MRENSSEKGDIYDCAKNNLILLGPVEEGRVLHWDAWIGVGWDG